MGNIINKLNGDMDNKADNKCSMSNATFLAFTTVTKEELERRRVPVYPYLL